MRDRQHYQFSLGGDKHLWWCRVGMGFKHERCNGDIQSVELDEKIVERWLGEWIDWSWKRGWFGGVESWQLCKDTVWTSLWCHCFYLKFLTTTKTSFLLALMRQRLARGMLLRSENVPLQRSFRHGTTRDAAGWRRILLCYVYCAYRGRWRWLEM